MRGTVTGGSLNHSALTSSLASLGYSIVKVPHRFSQLAHLAADGPAKTSSLPDWPAGRIYSADWDFA